MVTNSPEYRRAWHEAHPGRNAAYQRKWLADNLDKNAAKRRAYRARRRMAAGSHTAAQAAARAQFFGNRCWICSEPFEAMDHVIPLAAGGPNWASNLRPICTPCNSRKGARTFA